MLPLKKVRQRSPQEKKDLSYRKDRRNTYGEAPHGARKAIPLRKAKANRATRHFEEQCLPLTPRPVDEELGDEILSNMKAKPASAWKKSPDEPLGEVVQRKLNRRKAYADRPAHIPDSPPISGKDLFEQLFDAFGIPFHEGTDTQKRRKRP